MQHWVFIYLGLASVCFLLSAALTRAFISLAPRLGLLDQPADHKFHRTVTPVGGGAAICLSLLPVLQVPGLTASELLPVFGGCVVLAIIGLLDDLYHLSAPLKFTVLLAVTGMLWIAGIGVTTTRITFIDLLLTALWMTGVSSAFNALDNMDGLAISTTTIAAGAFLLVALQTEQWTLGALSAALVGSSLGFLVFNFPPARVFMGDTGSFSIGFLLASLGVIGRWNDREVIAVVIPVLILGLPIFDLVFTVVRRHMLGVTRTPLEALRHCDTDHISHRLVALGLTTRQALLVLCLLAASFALSATTLRQATPVAGILVLLQAVTVVSAIIPILCLADRAAPERPASHSPVRSGIGLLCCLLLAILYNL